MGRYIEWDDVVLRYPNAGRSGGSSEVGSVHITYAEAYLESRFSGYFTIPFSSNNLTAKDLSIDLTYLRIGNFGQKDRKIFRDEIEDRIKQIKLGNDQMITNSGDSLGSVGEAVYSPHQNYHPVFGMDDEFMFDVDSSQLIDEEDARG